MHFHTYQVPEQVHTEVANFVQEKSATADGFTAVQLEHFLISLGVPEVILVPQYADNNCAMRVADKFIQSMRRKGLISIERRVRNTCFWRATQAA